MNEDTNIKGWYNTRLGRSFQPGWMGAGNITVDKNERRTGEFEVVGWSRGRSSMQIFIKNTSTGDEFPMFMKDFFDTFCIGHKKNLTIKPVKRGANIAWAPV